MNDVCGVTQNEQKLIKGIQAKLGVRVDGWIGLSTLTALAGQLGADCFPLTVSIYGHPVIVCKDILPLSVNAPLMDYANAISGSFNDGGAPCSVLVSKGKVIWAVSCHYWDGGFPETVIMRRKDGTIIVKRVTGIASIADSLDWAVGGMGLLDFYAPAKEGFTGRFSDVLRQTNHTVLAVKDSLIYLCYLKNMTAQTVNEYCRKCGFDYAILLDGGHLAAINGAEGFARINLWQLQKYVIQAR